MHSYLYYLVTFSYEWETPFSESISNFIVECDWIEDAIIRARWRAEMFRFEKIKIISAQKIDCLDFVNFNN